MKTASRRSRPLALGSLLAALAVLSGCRLVKASPQVAFLGDSLTQGWSYPATNLGVHGNTTAQMLERFPRLIPGHGYSTVVILGGTNDVLLGIPPETTIRNLQQLGDETVRQHAAPILCEIPPIFHDYRPEDPTSFDPNVRNLNQRIQQLAALNHWKLADYYTPLAGHPEYSSDGVHMKRDGYVLMERALLHELPAY